MRSAGEATSADISLGFSVENAAAVVSGAEEIILGSGQAGDAIFEVETTSYTDPTTQEQLPVNVFSFERLRSCGEYELRGPSQNRTSAAATPSALNAVIISAW